MSTKIEMTPIDIRARMANYIKDYDSRILEIGPLKRCLLDREKYHNYFFADIRSTEEIKQVYAGNRYLEKTGISINIKEIIDIDYVIQGSYSATFKNSEKFNYIIVSHVLEHVPNLIDFFLDIQNIIEENGEIIIIYPDKRFCFDHFRSDSKFSDIYNVYLNGNKALGAQVLDFYTNVIPENDPRKFWENGDGVDFNFKNDKKKNLKAYHNTIKGKLEEDVHYWPFSDYAFIKFLQDASVYNLFPFSVKEFIPTQLNTQSFLVILSKGKERDFLVFKELINKAQSYTRKVQFEINKRNFGEDISDSSCVELLEGKSGNIVSSFNQNNVLFYIKNTLKMFKKLKK